MLHEIMKRKNKIYILDLGEKVERTLAGGIL